VCLSACTSQALLAAFEDLEAAVGEYNNPFVIEDEKPALGDEKPRKTLAPTTQSAATKAEVAAKEKTILSKNAALEAKDKELTAMKYQLEAANTMAKSSLTEIIAGAKAEGVCIYLHCALVYNNNPPLCHLLPRFSPQVVPEHSRKSLPTCATKPRR